MHQHPLWILFFSVRRQYCVIVPACSQYGWMNVGPVQYGSMYVLNGWKSRYDIIVVSNHQEKRHCTLSAGKWGKREGKVEVGGGGGCFGLNPRCLFHLDWRSTLMLRRRRPWAWQQDIRKNQNKKAKSKMRRPFLGHLVSIHACT